MNNLHVTIFGKRGEAFAKYHDVGSPAFFSGRLVLDAWLDKETQEKRTKLCVIADEWQFCGEKRAKDGDDFGPAVAPIGVDGAFEGSMR